MIDVIEFWVAGLFDSHAIIGIRHHRVEIKRERERRILV
jgi:hypothetical protein